jgi:hypothetical protein
MASVTSLVVGAGSCVPAAAQDIGLVHALTGDMRSAQTAWPTGVDVIDQYRNTATTVDKIDRQVYRIALGTSASTTRRG